MAVVANERTRLVVRGLPAHCTPEQLRAHFSRGGTVPVTDARIARPTSDGRARRFGFVGFKNAADAKAALAHFDGSFIDTSRIAVEVAKPVGDRSLTGTAWSAHTKGTSAHARRNPHQSQQQPADGRGKWGQQQRQEHEEQERQSAEETGKRSASQAELDEFLDVARPSRGRETELAEQQGDASATATASTAPPPKKRSKQRRPDGAVVVQQTVPNRRRGGDGLTHTQTRVKFADSDSDSDDDDSSEEEYQEMPSATSDLDWLRANAQKETDGSTDPDSDVRMSAAAADGDGDEPAEKETEEAAKEEEEEEEGEKEEEKAKPFIADEQVEEDELAANSGRILVQNIPYVTTEQELSALCARFGPVTDCVIPVRDLGGALGPQSRGFGFVQFLEAPVAARAVSKLDGTIFQGRLLRVIPARPAHGERKSDADDSSSSVSDRRLQKQKELAGSSHNWNALFLSSDAVAAAAAERLGVSKHELLVDMTGDGSRASSGAVRLALAETDIIRETKEFLLENHINLGALSEASAPGKKVKRSASVILVKNLPASTQDQEIWSLFSEHGELLRCLLPPAKAIALVEFSLPAEAKRAFSRLSYSKFKHVPLFLEWAPEGVFTTSAAAAAAAAASIVSPTADSGDSEPGQKANAGESGEPSGEPSGGEESHQTTIYVKNLSWTATEDEVRQFFESQRLGVRSVSLATKTDAVTGRKKPIGYGFVEFNSRADAVAAVSRRPGHTLNGRALQVSFAGETAAAQRARDASQAHGRHRVTGKEEGSGAAVASGQVEPPEPNLAKLVVRNLPFEATKRDVRQLFSAFGTLKTVRVPQRFDGRARGFAFVEFATSAEAGNALASLAHTHIYGRHLVTEWATTGDAADTQTARDKAAREDKSKTKTTQPAVLNASSRKDNLILPSEAKRTFFEDE
jgi:multiple RNA-binding domain-containing protein 1